MSEYVRQYTVPIKMHCQILEIIKLCSVKQRNCCETKAGSGSMLPEHRAQPAYGYRNSDGMLPKHRRNFTRRCFAS